MRIDGVAYPQHHPHRTLPVGGDAFEAPPGAVPFARFLEAQNRIDRAETAASIPPSAQVERSAGPRTEDFSVYAPVTRRPWSAPRLGDVSPTHPLPTSAGVEIRKVVFVPGATGRMIDLVV